MNTSSKRYVLSLLLLTLFIYVEASSNDSLRENPSGKLRKPRVSGRIVKVYSGTRPEPVLCATEGFQSDPVNCTVFYRCVKESSGRFSVFRYQCTPGTVYDPDLEACNFPKHTKRLECGGITKPIFSPVNTKYINKVEGIRKKLNHPFSKLAPKFTKKETRPSILSSQKYETPITETINDDADKFNNFISEFTTTNPWTSTTVHKNEINNDWSESSKCISSGIIGDSKNCYKTFHKCVDLGNGGYIKYPVTCGEGTVWDPKTDACNNAWAVKECGDHSFTESNKEEITTSTTKPTSDGITKTTQGYHTTTTVTTTSTTENTHSESSECTSSGIIGDSKNCYKTFYKCVDLGDGGYIKYLVTCGEGTVWDPKTDACNDAWAVKSCGGSSNNQQETETTTDHSTTSKQTTTEESTTTEQTTTTTEQQTTSEQTTTQDSTTIKQTTHESTTSEHTTEGGKTTESTTTTEQTESTTDQSSTDSTTESTTTTEQTESTTDQSSTDSTTESTTTTEQTESTTDQSSTDSTTESTTTTEQTESTTDQSSTDSTTESTTTTEQTESTTDQSSTDSTTESTTTTKQTESTTDQSSTDSTTESTTTTEQTESTTDQSSTDSTTTEEQELTTETSTSSNRACSETEDDQFVLVCPTSLKRHPKYCNMFYQCTEDEDTHDVNVAMFKCPNETIYDESQTQCVEEKYTDNTNVREKWQESRN